MRLFEDRSAKGKGLEQFEQVTVVISCAADEGQARRAAREIANVVGFDEKATEEIVIVASELASNITRHAGRGALLFTKVTQHGRDGIQIESQDSGPGITDVNEVLADGFSTMGGLGYGLGTVNRLMDEFEINSKRKPRAGTSHHLQKMASQKEDKSRAVSSIVWSGHALSPYHEG